MTILGSIWQQWVNTMQLTSASPTVKLISSSTATGVRAFRAVWSCHLQQFNCLHLLLVVHRNTCTSTLVLNSSYSVHCIILQYENCTFRSCVLTPYDAELATTMMLNLTGIIHTPFTNHNILLNITFSVVLKGIVEPTQFLVSNAQW